MEPQNAMILNSHILNKEASGLSLLLKQADLEPGIKALQYLQERKISKSPLCICYLP